MADTNKYLFDLHNFDSGIDFDPDNPPAPTFSEDELATARAEGMAEGIKKGLADAQVSRDQQIAALLTRMGTDVQKLITAETTRNQRFEQELIALVQSLYQKTFPILNSEYSSAQIAGTISSVLASLDDASLVAIEIAPQDMEDLSDRLKPMLTQHMGQVSIIPQTDVEAGSFRMKWKDGGAVRDVQALATQLSDALARALTDNQQK